MALCATAMDGSCDLNFKPDCTVMTPKCKTEMFIDDEVSAQFELPQNCIVAFIDDAAVQRKIFSSQIKKLLGIPAERLIVSGGT